MIAKSNIGFRGFTGIVDPQDRARFDRAVEVAETVEAVVETVTQAEGTAVQASEAAQQAAQTAAAGAVAAVEETIDAARQDAIAAATTATQAASTAAADAAAAVAPAAADAIRAQVAADADRAEAAAASVSLGTVRQLDDGTWPARTSNPVVHWIGWDNPGPTRMGLDDLWFGPAIQTVAPEQIALSAWKFHNAMDGTRAVLRLLQGPVVQRPAVLRYEYRITYTDAQGDQIVGPAIQFPMTPGETFLTGYTEGQVLGAEIRAVNVKGAGAWSAIKAATVSTAPFVDDFNRPNQSLRTSPNWVLNDRDPIISSNQLSNLTGNSNWAFQANVDGYFPDDQFVEAEIVRLDTGNRLTHMPMQLMLRGNVRLRLRNGGGWAIMSGGTTLASGTAAVGATFTARLELRGTTATALINGVVVGAATSLTPSGSGTPGFYMTREGNVGNVIDNFRAGALA